MWEVVLAACLVLFTAFYFYVKYYKMSFWRRRGIPEDPGFFPFGGQFVWDLIMQRIGFTEMVKTVYRNHGNEKVVGTYEVLGNPSVLIRDLDIAKLVLIKDFDQFMERKPSYSVPFNFETVNNTYIPRMLVELRGKEWKQLRTSLTPAFTSGKLKSMVSLIHKVVDNCHTFLDTKSEDDSNMEDLMRDYAMDVIVSTGFGYDCDSFNQPDNIFKKQADKLFGKDMNWKTTLSYMMFFFMPKVLGWLDWPFLDKHAEEFFSELIKKTISERQESGEKRNDFIDICLEILTKEEKVLETGEERRMNREELDKILIANSLMMFLAGLETLTNVGSLIMYFMATNEDCQEKLHKELKEAADKKGDVNFDYTTIMNLPYLEKVFQESQRMYPMGPLERASVNEYTIPGTNITIPKDIYVRIPVGAIVKDAKYFPDPEVFNPDNFDAEKKAARHSLASGGFGHGPRNCIAQRFATMEVKILVARILHKYHVLRCEKTVDHLVPDTTSTSFLPKGGTWIAFQMR